MQEQHAFPFLREILLFLSLAGILIPLRSRDEKHACALKLAGASVVVPETLEASLQLSAFVLEAIGLDERLVDGIVDHERELFAAALDEPGLERR